MKLGHEVTLFHRGETKADLPVSVEHVHGDFASFDQFVPELREREPDVVVDMWAVRQHDGRRVRSFKGIAERGVVLSSVDVYRAFGRIHRSEPGEPDPLPLTELSALREKPVGSPWYDPLDYNKTGVELEARADPDFPVTILRLPATHGPGDIGHRLHPYLKRMADGRRAILLDKDVARWRWARGYVEDVAHAVCLAVDDPCSAGRIYNVADEIAYSEAEWVGLIGNAMGWSGEVVIASADGLPEYLRSKIDTAQDYVVDSSRVRSELGYAEMADGAEALRRTIEWELANPPDPVDENVFDYAAEDVTLAHLGR